MAHRMDSNALSVKHYNSQAFIYEDQEKKVVESDRSVLNSILRKSS